MDMQSDSYCCLFIYLPSSSFLRPCIQTLRYFCTFVLLYFNSLGLSLFLVPCLPPNAGFREVILTHVIQILLFFKSFFICPNQPFLPLFFSKLRPICRRQKKSRKYQMGKQKEKAASKALLRIMSYSSTYFFYDKNERQVSLRDLYRRFHH